MHHDLQTSVEKDCILCSDVHEQSKIPANAEEPIYCMQTSVLWVCFLPGKREQAVDAQAKIFGAVLTGVTTTLVQRGC